MRGTPLLLQLIFVYYVLPSVGIVFDRLPAAILAFTLNYAAYFAEIFRGGILAIPKGQYEAAKMLKLSPFQTIRYIILPQVVKIVLPSIFNEIINLVKDSSLVYVLGVGDLLLESRTAANRDATLAPMFVAGAIYLILLGERACLVRADHPGAPQGLHGGQALDDGPPPGHAGHPQGQHNGDDGGQPLGDGGHRQGEDRKSVV